MVERKPTDSYNGLNDSQIKISKWQKASVDITNLKFKLGNILDGFTQEERESKKYEELLETVNVLFDHILGQYKDKINKETEKLLREQIKEEIKTEKVIFTPKTAVVVVCSAVLYKLLEKAIIFLLTF